MARFEVEARTPVNGFTVGRVVSLAFLDLVGKLLAQSFKLLGAYRVIDKQVALLVKKKFCSPLRIIVSPPKKRAI